MANFSTKAKHITLYNALYALFYWFFGNAWFFLYFFALVECGLVNEEEAEGRGNPELQQLLRQQLC